MNIKNKKILLGTMTSMFAVATPIATVVSCNNKKKFNSNAINLKINFENSIKYAKTKATDVNNKNNNRDKNPFGYFVSNIVENVFAQVGSKIPSIKNIATKLSKVDPTRKMTYLQLLGTKITKVIFSENNLKGISTGGKGESQSLQGLAELVLSDKAFKGPKGLTSFRDLADTILSNIEKGLNPLNPLNTLDSMKTFADEAERQKIFNMIKGKVIPNIAEIALGFLGLNPAKTIKEIISQLFSNVEFFFGKAEINIDDIKNILKELEGKKISIEINVFDVKKIISIPKIHIDKSVADKVDAILNGKGKKIDITVALEFLKGEINNFLKVWDDEVTLANILIDKKSLIKETQKYNASTPVDIPKNSASGSPLENILKKLDGLVTSGAINSIVDIFELIKHISKNEKLNNSTLAFENPKNIKIFKDMVNSLAPGNENYINTVFKTLASLASLYK